jgi:TRAP-type mannitol/chloroaromatic compound transport system permease small subunit
MAEYCITNGSLYLENVGYHFLLSRCSDQTLGLDHYLFWLALVPRMLLVSQGIIRVIRVICHICRGYSLHAHFPA